MINCKDNEQKLIYKYVIDNFDNAPFIRRNMPTNDVEKRLYKELMKTFVKFVEQLKQYTDVKTSEKNYKLEKYRQEQERVSKKRREISELNNLNVDLDNLDITKDTGDITNHNKKRTRRF
jgi:uncharacterized membrane protein YgaE (UPF0421/DUF939 family)